MSVSTVVERRPPCDLCRCRSPHGSLPEAQFDAKLKAGGWAYLCLPCYKEFGIKLGTGFGQRLYLRSEVRDDDDIVDPLHANRFDDGYDPEPDYDRPTKYDVGPDGEV